MNENNSYNGVIAPDTLPKENIGDFNNKKGHKTAIILVVLLVLIALGGALYFGWKKFNNKSNNVYELAINNVYEFLSKSLKENKKSNFEFDLNEPYTVSLDATLNSNMDELKKFSGLRYGIDVGVDLSKEEGSVAASIDEASSNIVDLLIYFKNGNGYIKADKIIDKIIDAGEYNLFEEMDFSNYLNYDKSKLKANSEDLEYILKTYKNLVIASLDKSKIVENSDNLTIDGKEYKVTASTYTIDKAVAESTTKYIINGILNDDKFLNCIENIFGIDKNEIKDSLNSALKSMDYSDYKTVVVNLYADSTNKIIAGSFVEEGNEILNFANVDKFNMTIESEDSQIIIEETNDSYDLVVKEENIEIINLKFYKNINGFKLDYVLNVDSLKMNGTIGFSDYKEEKTSVSGKFAFSFNTSLMGKKINLELDGNYSMKTGAIKTLDPSNSVKADSLSEEELMKLYNNLSGVLRRLGLEDLLESM